MFKIPMREIRRKFTVSELTLTAWRSKEMSANMRKTRTNLPPPGNLGPGYPEQPINPNQIKETENAYILPEGVNAGVSIPKKFFDKQGDLNLSQVTGPEAVRYLNALGLNIGVRM
jgi:hypothetical protein